MLKTEPTRRFSARVENYVRYRPSYPSGIIDILRDECGLTSESIVADIASGTGIFTRFMLANGNRVFAVEPNADMRRAGEEYLAGYSRLVSVDGRAEATTLADRSVDLVTCAQAAHWFDRERSLEEFARILKPGGFLVLIWNDRQIEGSVFNRDYERLVLKYGTDYLEVRRRDQASGQFFGSIPCGKRVLSNYQELDYDALQGRLLSSSYTPQPGDPSCEAMCAELRRVFDAHQRDGRVRMDYDTNVYFGKLTG